MKSALRTRTASALALSLISSAWLHPALAAEVDAPAVDPAPAAASTGDSPTTAAAAAEPAAPSAPSDAPAADPVAPPPADVAPPAAPPPKKPPYSLPWALRPVMPGNVVRSDTAFAMSEPKGKSASTIASMLLFSYKVTEDFAPLVRLGVVSSSAPSGVRGDGAGFLNPVLGGIYGVKLPAPFKLGLFLGLTVPVGSGGGDKPNADTAGAMKAGIPARSAMDNAMFAQNYFTVFPGVDFAVVAGGFTAQVEATIFRLTKVRGPDAADDGNTNFTTGLHVGYFLIPELSLGAELRHQRWLSKPAVVRADPTGAARDTTTFAVGPRMHLKLGEKTFFRPGVSFAMPLDNPMSDSKYKIVQLDLPLAF